VDISKKKTQQQQQKTQKLNKQTNKKKERKRERKSSLCIKRWVQGSETAPRLRALATVAKYELLPPSIHAGNSHCLQLQLWGVKHS
jgi:hypothetical protein